ncbi:Hypothetical protein SMAX5B_017895 [Scophthalmus maximus]|uniref:Uncharacterized protein n=1 Tax=Scophthalmus maximus TaxID=52904 RepID=A0A2U9CG80_SCOMX|nr:Hypothetical protein SMAX5B_017895 [Scophthalmus maximus]
MAVDRGGVDCAWLPGQRRRRRSDPLIATQTRRNTQHRRDESLAAVERPLLQATMCEADVNNQQQDRAVLGQLNCPQCGSLGRR